ncbi:uncharacterized protein BX664DRAFT_381493 [Halteromyces radiatus]|uniref:uncharacterized protein n=1 Tax=Halteromyces radiatus TaxID=101107 RepID=UPI002220B608|nr:uncharacterized protein BX664DRAFT_381493 [Halteromyces radiatus]KAI8098832.1 hypothetical protein BX664DRAFT_381493 [Halteromyces radiatus]
MINSLQSFSDELILMILYHLKQDNHLDLAPIANTCRRFQRLVSDYSLWDMMIMMDTSSLTSEQLVFLPIMPSHKSHSGKEIIMVDPYTTGILALHTILKRHDNNILLDVSLYTNDPSSYWSMLTRQYDDYNSTFKSISITELPPSSSPSSSSSSSVTFSCTSTKSGDDSIHLMSDSHHVDPFMYSFLSKVCPHLEMFTFPMLSLHKLIATSLVFPQLHTLNVALPSATTQDDTNNTLDWSKVKHTFPNLQHLTLHPISDHQLEGFWKNIRLLWTTPTLFPWLHSMTIQSNSSSSLAYPLPSSSLVNTPNDSTNNNNSITKDEIIATLSRLNGLIRIDTGCWDIIAVDHV